MLPPVKPYNPLEKENLGRSVALSLVRQPAVPMAGISRFQGAGVYAIYYTGDYDAYAPIQEWNRSGDDLRLPIYVGKGVPKGGRRGMVNTGDIERGTALFSRLNEHRKSIEQVNNLSIADFCCRFLVVDDIWIPLGETLLIRHYRPLWNARLDGFGNHDPGKGRYKGACPAWDTLHPGRSWTEKCGPFGKSAAELREQIGRFWQDYRLPPEFE